MKDGSANTKLKMDKNEATGMAVENLGLIFYTKLKTIYLGKLEPTVNYID